VVLIAGKGHEDYQEVHGQRHPFSDVEEAAAALSHRATAPVLPTTPPMSTLGELHALLEARLPGCRLIGEPATPVWRVHTDTRTLAAGDLFVALKGERFDAHDFLPGAAASGATAVVGEHGVADCGLPGIEVPDTLRALQALGAGWRAAHALPVIGVTGSNGKTTVTQMTAAILRAEAGDHALATAGNLNNHIGVPMTVLRLADHRLAVVELGMNHPGEIAELAAIAAPTVALVNNAQREHLEFMRTVQAVANEHGSVISALPADGVAVFPADDVYTPLWREMANGRRTLTFALDDDDDAAAVHVKADLRAAAQWQVDHWQVQMRTPAGEATVALHVAGRHMVKNALAATACALAAGVPLATVVRGLEAFRPVKGRAQVHRLSGAQGEATLIDDSYNANPDSVRAAIDVLATLPEPGWLVLGDMGEVGDEGPAFHAEAGAHALAAGLPNFWCAGTACAHAAQAYGPGARHFATVDELIAALDEAPAYAAVLVKGSRFMRMERVVEALRQRAGGPQGGAHAA